MKTFPALIILFVLVFQEGLSQFTEDFSDMELASDPPWSGTLPDFVVNAEGQLQLNAAVAGTSWITTPLPASDGITEWEFYLKQSFSPSGANFGRVYLVSDREDLSSAVNGYFIQFGEAGSSDAMELFRQSGTAAVSVCRADPAAIASAFAIRVRVIRDGTGLWELQADYSGGSEFVTQASGSDTTFPVSGFFGWRCTYTITNSNRFYADDIAVRTHTVPDTVPPRVDTLEILSAESLRVQFDEPLNPASLAVHNFEVVPGPGFPWKFELSDDARIVTLSFPESFANGKSSVLEITGISDMSGNTTSSLKVGFFYFIQKPVAYRDIIFTEILADPTPGRGLPEVEYVEIYNRGIHPANLRQWILADATSSAGLPEYYLQPGEYVALTARNSAAVLESFGPTLPVTAFPTLNNGGDSLWLTSSDGVVVDSIAYDTSWYNDSEKADGGWSIELIDLQNICDDKENWTASEAEAGGTPGRANSVAASRPDNMGPVLVGVVAIDSVTVSVDFDEKLEAVVYPPERFLILPEVSIRSISLETTRKSLVLRLERPLTAGMEYTLSVSEIFDCAGNKIEEKNSRGTFLLPQAAAVGDVVINEILFNPRPGGVDFIEIYNRSEKVLNVRGWSLRNWQTSDQPATVSGKHLLLRPNGYLVLTSDADILKGEYANGAEENFLRSELPALNDDDGSVVLSANAGMMLDSVFYSEDMHSPFVKDDEGISLERISAEDPGGADNWRSASSVSGFATPGYRNSNARSAGTILEEISIEPEVIQLNVAPLDFARIHYRFDRGGLLANVRIYDQQSRCIRSLASNELLGSEGQFRWDGDDDRGNATGTGYYFVWFEVFDGNGLVQTFRRRIAVF